VLAPCAALDDRIGRKLVRQNIRRICNKTIFYLCRLNMPTDIEQLIADAEAAIESVQSGSFVNWCQAQGFNPDKVSEVFQTETNPDLEKRARELFADDMADISREVESRAIELGISQPAVAPQATAARQRRRMGMV